MLVSFTLTMPRNNSWNEKFSGDDRLYAKVMDLSGDANGIIGKSFYYDFGDGWTACIDVAKVNSKEAAKIRKASIGFMGYNWMISSIILHGAIFRPGR